MRKRLTTKEFIEKAQAKHGLTYDYSLTEYVLSNEKVTIICKIHGPFMQKPNSHLNGSGCPGCIYEIRKLTTEKFIERSQHPDVHGHKYDYSETDYINNKINVTIICKIHGPFQQTPKNHLNGSGCISCGNDKRIKSKTEQAAKDFIPNSIAEHGTKYDYSETEYIHSHEKVKIICKEHGPFLQTPNDHLQGKGCSKCGNAKISQNILKLYENNKKLGSEPGIFYVLKFKHKSGLEFIKAGITKRSIKERYKGYNDFTYEILEEHHLTNLKSALKEQEFMNKYKEYKFDFPDDIKFGGYTETFNITLLDII